MAYTKYSLTPANNNATPPDGAPEGMLPSAVNDTMRDMMAQIRDCGDGIRDGTYTMTAPKITGGTITGSTINNSAIGGTTAAAGAFTTLSATGAVTFSNTTVVSGSLTANTFSSSGATITGGSINGTAIGGSTAAAGAFTTLTASGATTFTSTAVISVNSSSAALRITQVGSGNALLVEDSTNPDATPFVVDANGNALLGITTRRAVGLTNQLQVEGTSADSSAIGITRNAASTGAGYLILGKSRGTTTGSVDSVESGDQLGRVAWYGADGTSFVNAANILGEVDGTPGTNDMPGRLVFSTTADGASSPTERMRITSGGGLLVNTTTQTGSTRMVVADSSGNGQIRAIHSTGSGFNINQNAAAGDVYLQQQDNAGLAFTTNNTERMRITSGGQFLVATTSGTMGTSGKTPVQRILNSSNALLGLECTGTSSYNMILFNNGNGEVGTINTSGSATIYSTSSDYRLKENIAPMTGALNVVQQLKPCTYTWKSDGSAGQGFIAHELQAVVPDCVTGEKDAVDSEGKPVYQGVDTSFLVATLTAAIQEQQAMIEELKAEVALLKSK